MVIEVRKTAMWGTAAAAVVSAALLAVSGAGPRTAAPAGEAARAQPVAPARVDLSASARPAMAGIASASPSH